jgi:hypothetical protein
MSVALLTSLPFLANEEGDRMSEQAKKVVGAVATAMSIWQRLTYRAPERERRRYRQDFLPTYSPGAQDLPTRGACDIELPVDELAQALALGRSFGSVRTSVLQASLAQLRSVEAKGLLTTEGRELKTLVDRQLARRCPQPLEQTGGGTSP